MTSLHIASVNTEKAPAAVGPYSQGVIANGFLFVSGQIPLDPATGVIVEGDISVQTKRVMENIGAVLQKGGLSFLDVVKCDLFLASMDDFAVVNEVYASYFTADPKPARQTVEVSRLPKGALIEISCIAALKRTPEMAPFMAGIIY